MPPDTTQDGAAAPTPARTADQRPEPAATADGPVQVTQLRGWRDRALFVDLPYRLHRNDPNWVPQLRRDIRLILDRRRNPFFQHGEACFWLAWRAGVPVGRISAQINRLHLSVHHDETGNFGMLEAIDDQAVFAALLRVAEDWLRERGMRRAIGPYSLSINDEIGILISGFDTPPMIGLSHAPAYYAPRLEAAGYRKVKDVHALRAVMAELPPTVGQIERVTAQLRASGRLAVRFLDRARFADEVRLGIEIYNEAWTDNWGFVPVTPGEVDNFIMQLKPILPRVRILFATVDGETAAMLITLPDVNELLMDLNGRLFPLGWMKMLWRVRYRRTKGARAVLAGVRRRYAGSAISTALMTLLLATELRCARADGTEVAEFSWILEDNKASLEGSRSIGGHLAKVYRIFGKRL